MRSFGMSDIGLKRENNDDTFYNEDGSLGIYAVADGMGGYKGGKVASAIAIATLIDKVKRDTNLDFTELFENISLEIGRESEKNPELKEMGTTLTFALSSGNEFTLAHIGDSRAYIIDGDGIKQVTEDHTLVNALYRNGTISREELDTHPNKNVLLKAITAYEVEKPDVYRFRLERGSYLLLCTDGLNEHLSDEDILGIFGKLREPDEIAKKLIEDTLEDGGSDNVAVVIVKG